MIKNVIFDIGNVLAAFRWKDYISELGYSGELADRITAATVKSPMWLEIDRGAMPFEEIVRTCVSYDPEIEKEILHFYEDRRRLVLEYDYSEKWVESVKKMGYNIYILSNFSGPHFEYIHKTFSFFGLEDGMVISYQEKLLKPDHRIYEILMERYNLKAEECVFLDDTKANIDAAVELGMKGIVFENYEQGSSELNRILQNRQ